MVNVVQPKIKWGLLLRGLAILIVSFIILLFIDALSQYRSLFIVGLIVFAVVWTFAVLIRFAGNDNYWRDFGIIATLLFTLFGWFVNSFLNNQRDIANKRTELKIKYLLNAYYRFENAYNRMSETSKGRAAWFVFKKYQESAIGAVAVLSDQATVDEVNSWLLNVRRVDQFDSTANVILALRREIRKELGLAPIPDDKLNIPYTMRVNDSKLWTLDSLTPQQQYDLMIKLNEADPFK
jgi:hypothetical protein